MSLCRSDRHGMALAVQAAHHRRRQVAGCAAEAADAVRARLPGALVLLATPTEGEQRFSRQLQLVCKNSRRLTPYGSHRQAGVSNALRGLQPCALGTHVRDAIGPCHVLTTVHSEVAWFQL